jgi:hypothetical protein
MRGDTLGRQASRNKDAEPLTSKEIDSSSTGTGTGRVADGSRQEALSRCSGRVRTPKGGESVTDGAIGVAIVDYLGN